MHVIEIVGEKIGFGEASRLLEPKRYGPFHEIAHAEQVFLGKLWTRVVGDGVANRWAAQQGPTRLIHAEIIPVASVNEQECADPYHLPSGGTYYN
jgi:hypothetical protein